MLRISAVLLLAGLLSMLMSCASKPLEAVAGKDRNQLELMPSYVTTPTKIVDYLTPFKASGVRLEERLTIALQRLEKADQVMATFLSQPTPKPANSSSSRLGLLESNRSTSSCSAWYTSAESDGIAGGVYSAHMLSVNGW